MKLRAFLLFLLSVFIGTIVVPFLMWASAGFPDEGSHGLWIPVMFAVSLGLPGGAVLGLVLAAISFLFPTKLERAERELRKQMR